MKSNINVLVIDSNESLTNDVVKYFSNHEVINVVGCKNNGEEGLEFIINNVKAIDVIVMDLVLPKLDGMYILQELKNRKIHKNVIITTNFKDDNILSEANGYGIDYYMIKPINFIALERRILKLKSNDGMIKNFNNEVRVTNILHNLGIPSHVKGFNYIRDGILYVCKMPKVSIFITKDIYPFLAEKYESTPSRVERAIRHAIAISWDRGDINLMEELFGNSIDIDRDKPTNAEFISTIADKIKVDSRVVRN